MEAHAADTLRTKRHKKGQVIKIKRRRTARKTRWEAFSWGQTALRIAVATGSIVELKNLCKQCLFIMMTLSLHKLVTCM